MKICSRCEEEKEDDEFNWKIKAKGIRHKQCKLCTRDNCKRHYNNHKQDYFDRNNIIFIKNKKIILDYLSTHPCIDCGEADPIVLDFDHVNPTDKIASVASLKKNTKNVLLREMAKCEIRCANCHRRKTAIQFDYQK